MPHTIYHDFSIKASASAVFDTISNPEHLINWWPARCSGQPELDSEYNFFFGPEYDWKGKVVECIAPKAFYIKMTKSDHDWQPTSFGFDLEQINEEVKVQFWHKDWQELNEHFRIASFCWAILLQGLKNYVEKGSIVPFEERS